MKTFLPALLLTVLLQACSGGSGTEEFPRATCPEDLKGHTLGCMGGTLCDLQFDMCAPGATKLIYTTGPDLLAALEMGKADFIIHDSIYYVCLDESHPVEIGYTENRIGGNIGVAFRKTDTGLCRQFNEFLAQIKADGTYDELLDRWVSDKVFTSEMPDDIVTYTEGEPLEVGFILGMPCCFIRYREWAGMEVEMMARFASYLKRPFKVEIYDFSALMAALKTGTVDALCAFIIINEERSKEVLFSDPYFCCHVSIFQKIPQDRSKEQPLLKSIKNSFYKNFIVEGRWKMLVDGLRETVVISLFAILFGTLLGALICLMRMSKHKSLSIFARVYVEVLRGVPMLVLLMIMFYVVLASSGMSGRWVAIISFAINFSAYTCEIFRTGVSAVDRGQTEAGLAMGFTRLSTFFYFILPQAARNILPVFKNEAVSLVKGTSVVGYVAILDLTKVSDIIRARTFDAFFPLILISIIYFLLAYLLSKALDLLGKN